MLINLWMLKAPNGMFWYAVDYVRRLRGPLRVVVRPALLAVARRELSGADIEIACSGLGGMLSAVLRAVLRGESVYTPTPHPLPFVPRQLVVFHDSFPFEGRRGRLKLGLFRFGAATSGARVGYINRSAALPFLLACGITPKRLVFMPNVPPPALTRRESAAHAGGGSRIVLGAFGTDSTKKRYPDLVAALSRTGLGDRVRLRIYGQRNAYTGSLEASFPRHPFEIVEPREVPLDRFVASLDACISIAAGEGFGRPLATAVVAGVPCYLIESPTFREFFSGLAVIDDDVDRLLQAVASSQRPERREAHAGFLSPAYSAAIDEAFATLRAHSGANGTP